MAFSPGSSETTIKKGRMSFTGFLILVIHFILDWSPYLLFKFHWEFVWFVQNSWTKMYNSCTLSSNGVTNNDRNSFRNTHTHTHVTKWTTRKQSTLFLIFKNVQFDIVLNHTDMYFAHALPSMQSTWSNGSFTDECKVKITEKDQTLVFILNTLCFHRNR